MHFDCPHCKQSLNSEEDLSNQTVECPSCNQEFVPETANQPFANNKLNTNNNESNILQMLNPDRLRDRKERTAFYCLAFFSIAGWGGLIALIVLTMGIGLIYIGIGLLVSYYISLLFIANMKANAIRVSPTQFPEIYNIAKNFAEHFNQPIPEIYIIHNNSWNAVASKLANKRMVILLSGAVDSLLLKGDKKQLAWLIGHELGHHYAGHLNFWRRTTARLGSWFIWASLWYQRRCELTSDRYGLACANSLDASLRAVCNMTVGAQLASEVNIDEALNQWRIHRNEWLVKKHTRMHTHPGNLWRLEELATAAKELDIT